MIIWSNHHKTAARSEPVNDGQKYQNIVAAKKQIIAITILFLNFLPHRRESIVTGFIENCSRPVGSGRFGNSLGSPLP